MFFPIELIDELRNNNYDNALNLLKKSMHKDDLHSKVYLLFWLIKYDDQNYIQFLKDNSDVIQFYFDDLWILDLDHEGWDFGLNWKYPDPERYLSDYLYRNDQEFKISFEDFLINNLYDVNCPWYELRSDKYKKKKIFCTKYIDYLVTILEFCEALQFASKHGLFNSTKPSYSLLVKQIIPFGNIGLRKLTEKYNILPDIDIQSEIKHLIDIQKYDVYKSYLETRVKDKKLHKDQVSISLYHRKVQSNDLHAFIDYCSFNKTLFEKSDILKFLNNQSINAINLSCRTPLDIAVETGFFEGADILRELGAKTFLEIVEDFKKKPSYNEMGGVDLFFAQEPAQSPFSPARLNKDFENACISQTTSTLENHLSNLDPLTAISGFESALKKGLINNCILLIKTGIHPSLLRSSFIEILRGQYDSYQGLDKLVTTMIKYGIAVNFIDIRDEGLFTPLDYVKKHPEYKHLEPLFRNSDALTISEITELKGLEENDLF